MHNGQNKNNMSFMPPCPVLLVMTIRRQIYKLTRGEVSGDYFQNWVVSHQVKREVELQKFQDDVDGSLSSEQQRIVMAKPMKFAETVRLGMIVNSPIRPLLAYSVTIFEPTFLWFRNFLVDTTFRLSVVQQSSRQKMRSFALFFLFACCLSYVRASDKQHTTHTRVHTQLHHSLIITISNHPLNKHTAAAAE